MASPSPDLVACWSSTQRERLGESIMPQRDVRREAARGLPPLPARGRIVLRHVCVVLTPLRTDTLTCTRSPARRSSTQRSPHLRPSDFAMIVARSGDVRKTYRGGCVSREAALIAGLRQEDLDQHAACAAAADRLDRGQIGVYQGPKA